MLLLESSSTLKVHQAKAFSSHEPQVYIFMDTLMQIGQVVKIPGALSQAIASFLVNPLYGGEPRDSLLFPAYL